MAIGTLAQYKTLGNLTLTTAQDSQVQEALDLTEGFILKFLGASLAAATYTSEAYDGTGTDVLLLKAYPVASVASVVQKFDDGTTQTIPSTEYRVAEGGRLCLLGALEGRWAAYWGLPWDAGWPTEWGIRPCFTPGYANWLVTYTTTAPYALSAVKLAQYQMVDELRALSGSDPTLQNVSIGNYSEGRAGLQALIGQNDRRTRWIRMIADFKRGTCPI
jgi:hypothetical protein